MVLYTRVLPVVRTFISLPAGIARMSWTKFLLFTALGSVVWNTVLAYLGWAFGAHWEQLQAQFLRYTIWFSIAVAIAIVGAAAWGTWRWWQRTAAPKQGQ